MEKYYEVLGVSEDATEEEIKKAYKKKIRLAHPDKGGNAEYCKKLNEAKAKLLSKETETLTDCLKETYKDAVEEFSEYEIYNNFSFSYAKLLSNAIKKLEKELSDPTFYCEVCEKMFCNPQHHFSSVIAPYFDMIMKNDKPVHPEALLKTLKTTLGSPWDYNEEEEKESYNLYFWLLKENSWNEAHQVINHIKKYTKEICNATKFMECIQKSFKPQILQEISFSELCKNRNLVIKSHDWSLANMARRFCEKDEFTFALTTLKEIDVELTERNKNLWRVLGNDMGTFHTQLAIFCYNKCSFSYKEWLAIGKLYSLRLVKANTLINFHMAYICMENAFAAIKNNKEKTQALDKLFEEKEHLLAIYSLQAKWTEEEITQYLSHCYTKFEDVMPVLLVLKHILYTFPIEKIEKIRNENVLFSTLVQINKFPSMKIPEILKTMNPIVNESITSIASIIPLLAHMTYLKEFFGWQFHSQEALSLENFHSAIICMKLHEIESKTFDYSNLWSKLGFSLFEKECKFALPCLLMSTKTEKQLCSVVDELKIRGKYQTIIKLCVVNGNLTPLIRIGQTLKDKDDIGNANMFFWGFIKGMKNKVGVNSEEAVEKFLQVIELAFAPKMIEVLRFQMEILKLNRETFFTKAAFPCHYHFIKKCLKRESNWIDLSALLTGLHFLPPTEEVNKEEFKDLFSQLLTTELSEAYQTLDFKRLEKLIPKINKISSAATLDFLTTARLGLIRPITERNRAQHTFLELINGSVSKANGSKLTAMRIFELTLDTCTVDLLPPVISCIQSIFIEEPQFQESILRAHLEELFYLKSKINTGRVSRLFLLMILPDISPCLKDAFESSYVFDKERSKTLREIQEFQKTLLNKSNLDAGYLCITAVESFKNEFSPHLDMILFLMAASYFLKSMEEKNAELVEVYATRNILEEVVKWLSSTIVGAPHLTLFMLRMSFSILFRANHILAERLPHRPYYFVGKQVIGLNQKLFLEELLSNLTHFMKINPFVTTHMMSITDTLHMLERRQQILGAIYENKCKNNNAPNFGNVPRYVFSSQKYDWVFCGWIRSTTLAKAAEEVFNDCFEKRKWATKDIQLLFQLYLQRWNCQEREKDCSKAQVKLNGTEGNFFKSVGYIGEFSSTHGLKFLQNYLLRMFFAKLEEFTLKDE